MNEREHLLVCLAEECGEVAKNCHKALRFGEQDRNVLYPQGPTNIQRICNELNDLEAVVEMLVEHNILPIAWRDLSVQYKKKQKVLAFMEYAREQGSLQPPTKEKH